MSFNSNSEYVKKIYISPKGLHRHECPNCKTVWERKDELFNNKEAHNCPRCSTPQGKKYSGYKKPTEKSEQSNF